MIAIIVAVVVGAVVGTKDSNSSSYPDYYPLNYTINERMNGTTFFDHFDYFDKADPSSGNVVYLSSAQAAYSNLTYAGENSAILRVDDTSTGITDRNSIRITSKNQWNNGLFVFDVIHSPYGCGTWPAVWLSDPNNWPEHGEIDVIEAVEQGNKGNQMTLHTSKGCTMKTKRKETGTVHSTNCWNSTNENEGCGVFGPKSSYGAALNEAGGAVSQHAIFCSFSYTNFLTAFRHGAPRCRHSHVDFQPLRSSLRSSFDQRLLTRPITMGHSCRRLPQH